MSNPAANDAAFAFNALAGAIEHSRERRRDVRLPYECVQMIAPFDGVNLPPASAFRPVHCHDISISGLSFFLPQRPTFQNLVVSLGKEGSNRQCITARMVHFRAMQHEGTAQFLVGCEFIEKLPAVPTPAD
jgi:hypothetical protein